ncbi:hypothetical protein AIZ23_24300, partial [Salmonella enterica subsp. enterica serovar Typhimurium]
QFLLAEKFMGGAVEYFWILYEYITVQFFFCTVYFKVESELIFIIRLCDTHLSLITFCFFVLITGQLQIISGVREWRFWSVSI